MRKILTTLAFLSIAAHPALADDSRLVTSVKLADIEALVTEDGYTMISTGDDGDVSVRAMNDDGLIFNIIGTACETGLADGCLGLHMQVRYNADGKETLERINGANLMWAATAIWYTPTGYDGETPTVGISRYVILDNGVSAGNIKENLVNLLAIAPQAADYIWQAGEYADDYDDWDW
ncbi:MAG: YbjN domain-containing protein [Hyphomonas sp.]